MLQPEVAGANKIATPANPGLWDGPTKVMGILNVTPDSFSDGNLWFEPKAAIAHGLQMVDEGAAIVDVGGESTRPGAQKVDADREWQRIAHVVETLASRGVVVSVDTLNSETARRALDAGASIINDVSGGMQDPKILSLAAETGVPIVIQHWRGRPSDPDLDTQYEDVVADTVSELQTQIDCALDAGVRPTQIITDPGLGFGVDQEGSWQLVENLEVFTALGYPLLVGASRKRFIAARYGTSTSQLDKGTVDVTRIAVRAGVWAVRVHNVAANVRAIRKMRGA